MTSKGCLWTGVQRRGNNPHHTRRQAQKNNKTVYSGSLMRKSQIYKEHLKEQGIAVKWFPLTDPLVRWPEGAHPILGEQRQVIVQTKERCTCSHYQLYIRALWAPRRRSKPRHVT